MIQFPIVLVDAAFTSEYCWLHFPAQNLFLIQQEVDLHCPRCGAPNAPTSQFCSNCGNSLSTSPAPATNAGTIPPPYAATPQTSGKAIASLICGIINIFPLFIVAIILGHLALSDIKKSAGRLAGRGLAIAGLVLGYLGVVFIPIILIIAAIAIPNLLRARIAANEVSATASVRTLFQAEVAYSQTHADSGFTCNLSDLSSAGLVDHTLASGEKHGYRFELRNCASEADSGAAKKIQIVASPLQSNTTGVRAFCTDEQGVIRVDPHGSAEECVAGGSALE